MAALQALPRPARHGQTAAFSRDGRLETALSDALDFGADGRLDSKELEDGTERLQKMLQAGLPSAASFGTGFLLGLRS